MNLSWLEDFLALAASGSFSRAAADRHMTQPAFSRRIKALETWLGVDLFDRSGHPVALTETGRWFRSVADEILDRVARVPGDARAVADASASTLRFAATHALSLTFLPTWLRSLESFVAIGTIHLLSDTAQRCEALMLQGSVQFLLCHTHPLVNTLLDTDRFVGRRVSGDVLMPVTACTRAGRPIHRLDGTGRACVPLLAYSAESGLGRIVRSLQGAALEGLRTETVFTAHAAALLKSIVLDGRGVAWLPASLVESELDRRVLVPAGSDRWHIPVDIRLFRGTGTLPGAAESFWKAVDRSAAPFPTRPGSARLPRSRKGSRTSSS